ncbi:MAG: hypothetical protein P1V36_00960 [Planctomycetota bacterium]|nr:hypothetical protein [Planctomycetota bacterium]
MKNLLRLLLLALLAWVLWLLVDGSTGEDPGDLGDGSYLDGDSAGPGDRDLRDVERDADSMVGLANPRAGVGDDPSARADDPVAIELLGRVVDARRHPVAGAQVELLVAGQRRGGATTAPDGQYRMAVRAGSGSSARGTLLARLEGHGTGMAGVWLAEPGTLTAPPIVLEAAYRLQGRVEVDGKPSPFAQVAVVARDGGQVTPLALQSAGPDGTVTFDGLAAGLYELYALLPGRGRGTGQARLPQPEGEVAVLALGGERLLDVIVEDARTGEPVAGASVHIGDKRTLPRPSGPGYLPALPALTTNRQGRATVRGLGLEETIYVNVEAAGYIAGVWWRSSRQVARPGTSEVRVRLGRPRRVMFPIYEGDVRPPEDGTPLAVEFSGQAVQTLDAVSARVDGSYVVVEGLPAINASGVLTAPGGLQARFTAPAGVDMGNAVQFVAPRAVRVRVHEPGGAPVAGLALRLNPMDGSGRIPPAVTDAEGVATFPAVAAVKAGVHLRVNDTPWGGPLLGRIDLSTGEEEYTFELQQRIACVLRVRIDGESALPGRYTVTAAGQRVSSEQIVEDATTGELQVSVRPPSAERAFELQFLAEGYLPASVQIEPAEGSQVEHDIELRAAGRLVARVRPPDDGRYSLGLQRLHTDRKRWVPTAGRGRAAQASSDGVHAYEGLETGRYRVVDLRSGYESRPIDLVPGAPVEIQVDLSDSVEVQGRVQAPAGTDLTKARVLIAGRHARAQAHAGERVGADGSFRLRALRGERVELTVTHPLLAAAAAGGRATVTAPGEAVTLRLEAGVEAFFRVAGLAGASNASSGPTRSPVQVRLYKGRVGGELVRTVQPVASAGVFTFGGFTPGTYALWIGLGSHHAPYTRTGVVLGRGRTDLGSITPSAGGAILIELRTGAAGSPTSIWASATAVGEPRYARHASHKPGSGPLRVTGLGKGTFQVLVRASGATGSRILYEGEVVVRGSGETRLEVDAR